MSHAPVHLAICLGRAAVALGWLLWAAVAVRAEDRVVVAGGTEQGARTLRGTIVDFDGRELKIELASGQQLAVPTARVLDVQSEWNASHVAGERAFAERKFDAALASFAKAVKEEERAWVRRRILARAVTCYENQGDIVRAGETFLLVMQSDPHFQYLEAAPLAWASSLVDGGVETRAAAWLAKDDLPPVQLVGASWALGGAQRAAAIAALRKIASAEDPRLAHVAEAQLWRANVATVGPQELGHWEEQIKKMPASLRGGPYLVVAKGWANQDARMLGESSDHRRRAATLYLRAAVLFPERQPLAVAGYDGALAAAELVPWPEEAQRIAHLLAEEFPDTPSGQAAQRKLQPRQ